MILNMDNIAITDNILACAQFKPQNDPTENIIRPFYYTFSSWSACRSLEHFFLII